MSYKQKLCKLYGQDTITVEDICIPIMILIVLGTYMFGGFVFMSDYNANAVINITDCFIITSLIIFQIGSLIIVAGIITTYIFMGRTYIKKIWYKDVIVCKKE